MGWRRVTDYRGTSGIRAPNVTRSRLHVDRQDQAFCPDSMSWHPGGPTTVRLFAAGWAGRCWGDLRSPLRDTYEN